MVGLLCYLALWVEALRLSGAADGIPALGNSAAAAVTSTVVEAGIESALADSGRMAHVVAKLAANPDLMPNMIEEVLRLTSPTSTMWRVVKSDTELGGVSIPAGSMVMLRFASANRDEQVFPDPDRFDVSRENASDQVAFGQGVHFCLGAGLARKEIALALRKLLERLMNPRLAAGCESPTHEPNILLHGLKDLNLEFDTH